MPEPYAPTCWSWQVPRAQVQPGLCSAIKGSSTRQCKQWDVVGAVQHQPRNSLDSRGRKGCTLHCLHGLMPVLPMPGKLPPPHPLLLAHKHFLTLHSTGMREGIQVSIPCIPLSRGEHSPGAVTSQGLSREKSCTAGQWMEHPPFLSSLKNKVPPAHLKRQNA